MIARRRALYCQLDFWWRGRVSDFTDISTTMSPAELRRFALQGSPSDGMADRASKLDDRVNLGRREVEWSAL